ncbi:MAG: hypothetical protein HY063_14485 [Bacteroidetes bacterium]|nr:hypothetical protein [Bacteroidota bacterium]
MKKKIKYFIVCFLLGFIFSCQKKDLNPAVVSTNSIDNNTTTAYRSNNNNGDGSTSKPNLCVCPGFKLQSDASGFSCPSGDGCSKIVPCPCPSCGCAARVRGAFLIPNFHAFENALKAGTLAAFFNSSQWLQVFPELNDVQNISLLVKLRSGAVTFVQVPNANTNTVFNLAVNASLVNNFTVSDVQFAAETPAGI